MQPAPVDFYSRDYYLHQSGGADRFQESHGRDLDACRRRALQLAQIVPGMTVLDIGCGRGELLLGAAELGAQAIGIDFVARVCCWDARLWRLRPSISPAVSTSCRWTAPGWQCRNLPAFDAVLSTSFVEHVPQHDLHRIVSQCAERMRPGGRLVFHTRPTREFLKYGQHVYRLLRLLQRKSLPPVVTEASELVESGHCNLHDADSMTDLVRVFPQHRVWYEFGETTGLVKPLLDRFGLARYLTRNLWGMGIKA